MLLTKQTQKINIPSVKTNAPINQNYFSNSTMMSKTEKERLNKSMARASRNLEIRIPTPDVEPAPSGSTSPTVKISRLNSQGDTQPSSEHFRDLLEFINTREQSDIRDIEMRNTTEEKLMELRKRLDQSATFLETTKRTIENVNLAYYKDMLRLRRRLDISEGLAQTEEKLDELYNTTLSKIQALKDRAARLSKDKEDEKTTPKTFEETVNGIVDTFSELERRSGGSV